MQRLALFGLLLFWPLASGCDGEPAGMDAGGGGPDAGIDAGGTGTAPCPADAAAADAGVASGPTDRCADALLMSGWSLRWDDEARNVAHFGVRPRVGPEHFPEGCPPQSALRGAALVSYLDDGTGDLSGGRVSATYAVVESRPAPLGDAGRPETLRAARGSTTVDLSGPDARAREPELVDLAAAGLGDAPVVAVVLEGFEIETDVPQGPGYPAGYDPALGYALRGLGASIGEVRRDGDDLSFEVGARLALGRTDDSDEVAAAAEARTRIVVYHAVVALPVEPTTGAIAYREQHRGHGPVEGLEVCRPSPETTRLVLDGAPAARAAPALTRFDLSLFGDDAPAGDRIRELAVRIGGFAYDPSSGEATMHVEGYASNAGPPPPRRPMDYAFEAEVALLQWEGDAEVAHLRFDAAVERGRADLALPLAPR